jgi:hypothetical protein
MNRSLKIGVLLFFAYVMSIGMLHAQTLAGRDSVKRMKELKMFYGNTSFKMDFTGKEVEQANKEIDKLRHSLVVVRLKTNRRQIEAYRKAGETALADKIELKTIKANLNIISACIRLYNYNRVYFMDVDDKAHFIATDTLVFSHLLFEKDTAIYLPHDSVYYLDFGVLYGREQANEWKYKEYSNTNESTNVLAESAFVIRDAHDKQLVPPTPFYSIALFQGGKKTKENLLNLTYDVDLFGPTSNSVIRSDFQSANEYDVAINRMNGRLYYCYSLIADRPELENNPRLWLESNPNKYLYPLWINVEKKLLSIQEGQGGQFIKKY